MLSTDGTGAVAIDNKYATTKNVQMGRISLSSSGSAGFARRRSHRLRILTALHGICVKIEPLQPDDEARRACREVARFLHRAKLKDIVGTNAKSS